ncbi:MAG: hypothetical protein HYU37_06880 [Acidobacteria bacterium]|nr:hypothetical protein [Acidobacteriota bacterium]
MSFPAAHRRVVTSTAVVLVPLLTLLAAEGVARRRIEGHHISVDFTIAGGRVDDTVIANTPPFFGAEPAEILGTR